MQSMFGAITRKQCALRHVWHMELMARQMRTSNHEWRPVTKLLAIQDLKGLSLAPDSAATRLFKDAIFLDQQYYPERLDHLFFINAPWIFKSLWAIISPWVDPVTVAKFHICYGDGRKELLKHIDAPVPPVEYGCPIPVAFTWCPHGASSTFPPCLLLAKCYIGISP